MSKKEIFLLIGQKGSGKSFIGTILDKEFGIKFIRVENLVKQIKKERDVFNETYLKQVFEVIENVIRDSLNDNDKIVFESTGLTDYFDQMLENLKISFHLTTIGIYTDSKTCLDRVKTRDQNIHINISDDQVIMINEKVKEKNFQTDYRIDNEVKTERELINELKNIIDETKI